MSRRSVRGTMGSAAAGKEWYDRYCTSCHGAAGAPGSAVFADTGKPVDLRDYVQRNAGKFPAARWIAAVATDNPARVHPEVWHRIRGAHEGAVSAHTAGRGVVASIAVYVGSLQD